MGISESEMKLRRATLINWIAEIPSCQYDDQIIHYAVNILDRFLSTEVIKLEGSQLVASACAILAG